MPTLLDLPLEIRIMIFDLPDIGPLHHLRLVCKTFNELALRSVTLYADNATHEPWLLRLRELDEFLHSMTYTVPYGGGVLSAIFLRDFTSLTSLEVMSNDSDDVTFSKYLTDALRCLDNLTYLRVSFFHSIEDNEIGRAHV